MSNLTIPITAPLSYSLRDSINVALYGGAFSPLSLFGASDTGGWWDLDDDMDTKLAFRRNLLLWSEDFSNAVWGVFNGAKIGNTIIDGVPCMEVSFDATLGAAVEQNLAAIGVIQTLNVRVRAKTTPIKLRVLFGGNDAGATVDIPLAWTDLQGTANGTANANVVAVRNGETVAKSFYIATAQCERGTSTTAYQKITDYNTEFLAQFPNHALFQDSAGTTAVTAVEQPLGMVKDKSGKGNHRTQATSGFKPKWSARKNLLLATATMSTQNVTTVATPYTISHTGTGTITLSGTSAAGPLVGAGSLTFTPTAGTLTMTVSGTVSNAQLEYGSTATTYQRVTTATDYNAIGFPKGCKYDGVDDGMATASVDFTATDKMSGCMGLTFSSDTVAVVAELSADIASNGGSFYLTTGFDGGGYGYSSLARGSAAALFAQVATKFTHTAPDTAVVTATHDIAGDLSTIRRNGVAGTNGTGDKGTGNFGNYPLYVGRRGGTSFPFTGVEYNTTIINRPLTATELTNLETFNATKSGVTL